ncbi:MAG: radical SAM protein [Candidatus Omnitrophica bacterium]|nr:radical SAM protein [Candidatus Omnitrophota bacterium]
MKSSFQTFGPIPSRRLGRSLGLNNIPPKICSYSCVYCQIGRTLKTQIVRQHFFSIEEIVEKVKQKVKQLRQNKEVIDYLSFVPDGEPTLDIKLGSEIDLLKPLGIKIAVITNGSLIWQESVREDLSKADWVCVKVDAGSEEVWHKINRPNKSLSWGLVCEGILKFAKEYKGELNTDTMLIKGVNDGIEEIKRISDFLAELKPAKSYIATPIRPPAESWVEPSDEKAVNIVYQVFSKRLSKVECLLACEGDNFASLGRFEEDLLNIVSVHPMHKKAVENLLQKTGAKWEVVERLMRENRLKQVIYQGKRFYMRPVK